MAVWSGTEAGRLRGDDDDDDVAVWSGTEAGRLCGDGRGDGPAGQWPAGRRRRGGVDRPRCRHRRRHPRHRGAPVSQPKVHYGHKLFSAANCHQVIICESEKPNGPEGAFFFFFRLHRSSTRF